MKTTKRQATARLFKKLSALRATLSNEERQILDSLIVIDVVDEVAAHKLTSKAVDKATTKATTKATEVAAHKLTPKATEKATTKATTKTTFRITFDPNSEEYKIQD
jgi:hypothetical protein